MVIAHGKEDVEKYMGVILSGGIKNDVLVDKYMPGTELEVDVISDGTDVLMPGMTGMDAAREIRSFDAAADIIFLTTSPGFAYESYGVRAAEYLLKPINAKLLYPVLDKLYLRDQKPQDGLTVKSNGMLVRLPFSQLSYVEVNGKHLFFNMADGTVYEVAASMREYEGALLARPEFMRVHRSYIVNMLQAEKLSPAGVITFSGHNVPVSRLLYGQLQKDYLALLFSGRDA